MKRYTIITAGGSGKRMGTETPKQFLSLKGKPILFHTIEKFVEFDDSIEAIVVLPENQIDFWKQLCEEYGFVVNHTLAKGGETRFHSVQNGLELVKEDSIVAIHDGVRPLVSIETIQRCFKSAEEKGNGIPVIPVNESLRKNDGSRNIAINRTGFHLVQTPQCFGSQIIKKAYLQDYSPEFTDDASAVEAMDEEIHLVDGNRENIKITTPVDLKIAEALVKSTD